MGSLIICRLLILLLLHVISGCKTYLDEGRFASRHNSVLNFTASSLLNIERSKLYEDLSVFVSPSVITGDQLRAIEDKVLYIFELTVGFGTNLKTNLNRKRDKFLPLVADKRKSITKFSLIFDKAGLGCINVSINSQKFFLNR